MYAVIMAGGAGRRFWPLSRSRKPKQLLNILGEETLLRQTADRLPPLIEGHETVVVTSKSYYQNVLQELPHIPPENIVAEPSGRNTAACLAIGAAIIKRYDPDAPIALIPADHHIGDAESFRSALQAAGEIARLGENLVTLGVEPTRPETGYGYIQKGELASDKGGFQVYRATRFVEKPDAHRAEQFFRGRSHLWNSGIFVLTANTAHRLMELHLPRLYQGMLKIEGAFGRADFEDVMAEVYAGLESVSIDYGVAEKASHVFVIPVNFGWSDIGSWKSLYELMPKGEGGNVQVGRSLCLDTTNSLIYSSGRFIAAIGLEDILIIDAGDAILVCPMGRDQDIKKLVELMENRGMEEYL